MRFAYLIALLLVLTPRVLAEGLPELGDSSQSTLSTLQERQLGEQIIREIRADPAFLDDPPLTDYLNNLGYRLASSSDEPKVSLELFALRDNSINAFALPGGFIGVHSGLLLATQSESELAAVLAHEIAHVTQHHIARILATQKQSLATSLAGIAIAILAARAGNGQLAQGALIGTQALAVQGQLNFTREHEQEADRIGLQTLDKAGFDVRGMAAFFERLQKSTRFVEGNAPSYLRT
ncbi:MAG: M48 family metalloprotease, partial [Burkholderiales bacterium]